jgi:hypothetical protein
MGNACCKIGPSPARWAMGRRRNNCTSSTSIGWHYLEDEIQYRRRVACQPRLFSRSWNKLKSKILRRQADDFPLAEFQYPDIEDDLSETESIIEDLYYPELLGFSSTSRFDDMDPSMLRKDAKGKGKDPTPGHVHHSALTALLKAAKEEELKRQRENPKVTQKPDGQAGGESSSSKAAAQLPPGVTPALMKQVDKLGPQGRAMFAELNAMPLDPLNADAEQMARDRRYFEIVLDSYNWSAFEHDVFLLMETEVADQRIVMETYLFLEKMHEKRKGGREWSDGEVLWAIGVLDGVADEWGRKVLGEEPMELDV